MPLTIPSPTDRSSDPQLQCELASGLTPPPNPTASEPAPSRAVGVSALVATAPRDYAALLSDPDPQCGRTASCGSHTPTTVQSLVEPSAGTPLHPVVVGVDGNTVLLPPGEQFRRSAESGSYQTAARQMNQLPLGDVLSYTDRLSQEALLGLEHAVATLPDLDQSRLSFALEVVTDRQVSLSRLEGAPEETRLQWVGMAEAFLRCRGWIDSARKELGVREIAGSEARYAADDPNPGLRGQLVDPSFPKSNPQIVRYHELGGMGRAPDDVPWCSSFLNFVMRAAAETGSGKPNAQSWLEWGKEVAPPVIGCIAVIRGSDGQGNDDRGHVGIVVGRSEDGAWAILGGNQGERVCVTFERRPIASFRVPEDYTPIPADGELPLLDGPRGGLSDR